jgi:hypothetical protein
MSDSVKKYHEMVESGEITPIKPIKTNKMKKTITDELIDNKLKERGMLHVSELDVDEQIELLRKEYDFDFIHEFGSANMYFYTESTADGYEVYIASDTDGPPYIGQDVYYYESDWFEKLGAALSEGITIYIDQYAMDESSFTYAIEEAYEELYDIMQTEAVQQLKDEGYEYKK